jgi:chromosome segregation ATPase
MLVVGLSCAAAVAGCDYWPPALQAQIEQLRTEVQNANMEKAQLQNQLSAAIRAKDDMQVQFDELTKTNREKAAQIANLEHAVATEREKVAKLTRGKAPAKAAMKPAHKSPSAKKKPTKKTQAAKRL